MGDSTVVEEWFAKAEEDYQFVSKYLPEENEFFAQLCFHCQQAAEKYFKTYIVAQKLPLRKTHDLKILTKLCVQGDTSFRQLGEEATLLNPYYVDTRYPAVWPTGFTKDDAQRALEAAGRVRELVKAKLSL